MIRTMDIGATFAPAKYGTFFPRLPMPPAFCRVFSKPGSGLPNLDGPAVAELPAGTVPWISHKDPVKLDDVTAMWAELARRYPGRLLRWTYHHEAAPMDEPDRLAYLAYWAALRAMAAKHPHIQPVMIQTNYAMRWRTDTDWRDWVVPGVALGIDCYPLTGFRYEPPESMFGLLTIAARQFRAPAWGVPELGAEPRGGQNTARWLLDCTRYLDRAGADFLGLWGAGDYEPTEPRTLAAFGKITGHDYRSRPNRTDPTVDSTEPAGHRAEDAPLSPGGRRASI